MLPPKMLSTFKYSLLLVKELEDGVVPTLQPPTELVHAQLRSFWTPRLLVLFLPQVPLPSLPDHVSLSVLSFRAIGRMKVYHRLDQIVQIVSQAMRQPQYVHQQRPVVQAGLDSGGSQVGKALVAVYHYQ